MQSLGNRCDSDVVRQPLKCSHQSSQAYGLQANLLSNTCLFFLAGILLGAVQTRTRASQQYSAADESTQQDGEQRMADLLSLEDMLVELLLQPLIGQVDTQLLKAVLLEALEAVDVQDANGTLRSQP